MDDVFFWMFVAVTILLIVALWRLYWAKKELSFYRCIATSQAEKLVDALVNSNLRDGKTIAAQGRAIKLYCKLFEDRKDEYRESKNAAS